jgi:hypothetical protein
MPAAFDNQASEVQRSVVHGLKKLKLMHLLGILKFGTVSAWFNASAFQL